MKCIVLVCLSLVIIFCGCSSNQPKIDFSPTTVPEESGLKLTQITSQSDSLAASYKQKADFKTRTFIREVYDVCRSSDKVVFLAEHEGQQLYVKDLGDASSNLQRTSGLQALSPAFSPDGARIAFCCFRDKKWNVFLIDAEKGEDIQQITKAGAVSCPSFFQNGKKILYQRFESVYEDNKFIDTYSVWSSDFEGSTPLQHGFGISPSFFPGSGKVCVVDYGQLWILELDTGNMECIFDAQNYLCYLPCVSPDGRQIAFHGICTDISPIINRDIFVIDADGSNLRRITYHPGNDYQPKWSKDGKSLFFVSQRGNPEGTYNIWKVALE